MREDFLLNMRILPEHRVNRFEDNCIRADYIFDYMAERVFDNPRLLDLLSIKIKKWLAIEKSEFTYALAGYISYLKEDFAQAEGFFIKALNFEPENIDTWLDLAFSLYHQNNRKIRLALKILFNFDTCAKSFRNKKITLGALEKTMDKL
ncbi:MAG: hypothetical protein PHP35_02055 [Candidatus Colwellbacteria bacterium]|nr:hypothetical protein [Candidatus Colwellbacteria bacterium]